MLYFVAVLFLISSFDIVNILIELSGSELDSFDVGESNWSSEVSVPASLAAGNYTIIVTFISTSETLPDEKVELPFTVLGTSTITLDTDSLKITRGETITLEGELNDHLGDPIPDQEIQVIWNGETLGTVITESDGDFSYDYHDDF